MPNPLTQRQAKILAWIETFIAEHQYPPNIREIGRAFKIKSPNGMMCHLNALEDKGHIRRDADTVRGIVLLKPSKMVSGDAREALRDLVDAVHASVDRECVPDGVAVALRRAEQALRSPEGPPVAHVRR